MQKAILRLMRFDSDRDEQSTVKNQSVKIRVAIPKKIPSSVNPAAVFCVRSGMPTKTFEIALYDVLRLYS
jgi:hypothetical protein